MNDELKILRSNYREYLLWNNELAPLCDRKKIESQLQEDGTLEGVDYSSLLLSGKWPPYQHLLAAHSLMPDRPDAARRMLDAWERLDPVSSNWWWLEIGIPQWLCRTLILLDEYVEPDTRMYEILARSQYKDWFTGQNLTWIAGIEAAKGLLFRNADMVRHGRDILADLLTVSEQEGLQKDWSFHQHGAQPQNGNYGLSWLEDMTMWSCVFAGTEYAFPDEKIELLKNFYLNCQRWMLIGDHYDINNCGRQFILRNPEIKNQTIRFAAECLSRKGFLTDVHSKVSGCKAWPCSDMMISRRKDYTFSLRMNSHRIIGCESCCHENLLGRYSADGAVLVYPGNKSLHDSLLLRNWRQVPGTTELMNIGDLMPLSRWDENSWNGRGDCCVWGEGDLGAAWMKQRTECVNADKAWFCLRDTVVCMGKNIFSDKDDTLATTVLQEAMPDKFLLNGNALLSDQVTVRTPLEVTAGMMKYIFPDAGEVHVSRRKVTASWQAVASEFDTEPVSGTMATVHFEHGVKPQDAAYCYLIVPATLEAEKVEFIKTPSALGIRSGDTVLIAFFEPDQVDNIVMEKAGLYIAQNGQEIKQFA